MIDESVIANLKASLGHDVEVVRQLIDIYTKDSPKLLAEAKEAIEKGDMSALTRAAHSLKSTSASMGAVTVLNLARALEQHAKGNDLEQCAEALRRLGPEVNDAIAAFARLKY